MKKGVKRIRMTEEALHNVVKESVKRVLKEWFLGCPHPDEVEQNCDTPEEYDEYRKYYDDFAKGEADIEMRRHPQHDGRLGAQMYAQGGYIGPSHKKD